MIEYWDHWYCIWLKNPRYLCKHSREKAKVDLVGLREVLKEAMDKKK